MALCVIGSCISPLIFSSKATVRPYYFGLSVLLLSTDVPSVRCRRFYLPSSVLSTILYCVGGIWDTQPGSVK